MPRSLTYHVVLRRDPDGQHFVEFGDYDRSVAREERDELSRQTQLTWPARSGRPTYHLASLPDAAQSTIDAEVARRNQQENSQ